MKYAFPRRSVGTRGIISSFPRSGVRMPELTFYVQNFIVRSD